MINKMWIGYSSLLTIFGIFGLCERNKVFDFIEIGVSIYFWRH